jgi:hypothetical protein
MMVRECTSTGFVRFGYRDETYELCSVLAIGVRPVSSV